jgi:4,5-dihydroxyphthalate decarboxylase
LKTAIGTYGHTIGLKDGSINSPNFILDHKEISPIPMVFRRMVRNLEFDVSEMALATYIVSKHFKKEFTALPIFLTRGFYHRTLSCRKDSSFKSPAELNGKKIGVRSYTFTPGVWTRGILKSQYGLNPNSVTWVLSGDEHVLEYQAPPNVISSNCDDLQQMLVSGEVDAVIGATDLDTSKTKPFFDNPTNLDKQWFQKTKIYPISHILVVKNSLLEHGDNLVREIDRVFQAGRTTYMDILENKTTLSQDDKDLLNTKDLICYDPVSYDFSEAKNGIETFIDFCVDQKLIDKAITAESLFPISFS